MKRNVLKDIMMASVTCVCAVAVFDYFRKNPLGKKCKCEEGCPGCCSCDEVADERLSAEPEDFVEEETEVFADKSTEDADAYSDEDTAPVISLEDEEDESESIEAIENTEEVEKNAVEEIKEEIASGTVATSINTVELEAPVVKEEAHSENDDKKSDINILSI